MPWAEQEISRPFQGAEMKPEGTEKKRDARGGLGEKRGPQTDTHGTQKLAILTGKTRGGEQEWYQVPYTVTHVFIGKRVSCTASSLQWRTEAVKKKRGHSLQKQGMSFHSSRATPQHPPAHRRTTKKYKKKFCVKPPQREIIANILQKFSSERQAHRKPAKQAGCDSIAIRII